MTLSRRAERAALAARWVRIDLEIEHLQQTRTDAHGPATDARIQKLLGEIDAIEYRLGELGDPADDPDDE